MPAFTYQAIDARTGRKRAGRIEGLNPEQAILKLKSQQLFPVRLELEKPPGFARKRPTLIGTWSRPQLRDRIHFIRQLAALVKAGVPLVRSLELIGRQASTSTWRAMTAGLADSIRNGLRFSEALEQWPAAFDHSDVNLVKAGEAAGRLDECLERLIGFHEKTDRLRSRVRAALIYPVVVGMVATGIVAALLVFVVPRFEAVFAGLLRGEPLPGLTRAVIATGRFTHDQAGALGVTLGAAMVAAIAVLRTPAGRRVRDRMVLGLPLLGDLALKASIARFARTLGVLLASGVPILAALRIARETADNTVVAQALARAEERVEGGEPLSAPLVAAHLFPPLVTGLIEVGEESGGLPEMLGHIAEAYDQEVDRAVETITALLEPLLIIFMAVVVGTVVISLFLPIVRIIQLLG